jgi:hypothetical protein
LIDYLGARDTLFLTEGFIATLGKLVTEKPVDFVDFDSVVKFNKN